MFGNFAKPLPLGKIALRDNFSQWTARLSPSSWETIVASARRSPNCRFGRIPCSSKLEWNDDQAEPSIMRELTTPALKETIDFGADEYKIL